MSFDDRFDTESTQDYPVPSSRYIVLFDAAHSVICNLTLWEHDAPGAVAALQAWSSARGLLLIERDRQGKDPCTAYEVEIPPPDRHWITVYARRT